MSAMGCWRLADDAHRASRNDRITEFVAHTRTHTRTYGDDGTAAVTLSAREGESHYLIGAFVRLLLSPAPCKRLL